jgi:glucosamine--fructose-6-phosphate aminotransferase (isomerizing)
VAVFGGGADSESAGREPDSEPAGREPAGGLGPVLAQIPMTVRLQLLAERFAGLRRQDPDTAIVGAWADPALWRLGMPGTSR